jgi:hypothetical protein
VPEGDEGYTTAPEEDDSEPTFVGPGARGEPPERMRNAFSARAATARERQWPLYPQELEADSARAASWDPKQPSKNGSSEKSPRFFSNVSHMTRAESRIFVMPPKLRIREWLVGHDLTPSDCKRDRDLMYLLLENRSFGYPGTNGTLLSNYLAYCLNRHPLISILTAHPLHPFTRPERLVVLTCSFCWAFLVKAVMHAEPLIDTPWYVFYTVVALLVLPYEVLIRSAVVCSCLQYDDSLEGHARKRRWLLCGRCVLAVLTLINLAWLSWGVWTTVSVERVKPYSLLRQSWSTILAKLWVFVLWFPTWLPVFLCFYNQHKTRWLEAHPPDDPCHVCATSTEDSGVSVLYWLLIAHRRRPPERPRVSKHFSARPIKSLPIVERLLPFRVRMPTRSMSDSPLALAPRNRQGADGRGHAPKGLDDFDLSGSQGLVRAASERIMSTNYPDEPTPPPLQPGRDGGAPGAPRQPAPAMLRPRGGVMDMV